MGRDDGISVDHVLGASRLLDQLLVGFVLVDAAGEVTYRSLQAERFLGRRAGADRLRDLLGDGWDTIVEEVVHGTSPGCRWREVSGPGADGPLQLSVRSTACRQADGERAALVSMYDVSVEIKLHARYREALAGLEEANRGLQRRVVEVLRAHEDDLAQLEEILHVAPAVFGAFLAEAEAAVTMTAGVAEREAGGDGEREPEGERGRDDEMQAAVRAVHTVKGNARGLGLHFIAGRAHAVEELLGRGGEARGELIEAVGDLKRAVARAAAVQRRLVPADAAPRPGSAALVAEVVARLEDARASGDAVRLDHVVAAVVSALTPLTGIGLGGLLAYLQAVARTAAEAAGLPTPVVETAGGDLMVPVAVHAALVAALPHLVRNAVVHGIERPAERVAAGKAEVGCITVEARRAGPDVVIRVRDDGRGLDLDGLRARAVAASDDGEAGDVELMFAAGVSTARQVGLDAGRGQGAAAAREAVVSVGGRIEVRSLDGEGVEIELAVPALAG